MSTTSNSSRKEPFSLTPEYDRIKCRDCCCSLCYKQEFCDRCSKCENKSMKKENCYRFEGALTY